MSKRNLFEELKSGLKDAKVYEQGKLTLKTTSVTSKERKIFHLQINRFVVLFYSYFILL